MPDTTNETSGDAAPTPKKYTRFVILSAARTGSNMLASLLSTSPEITCFRELFNQPVNFIDYGVDGYDPDSVSDRELRDNDPVSFLGQRVFCEHPADIRAVGYKMLYEHFYWFPTMQGWIAGERDIRIVHLRRRNLLRSFASVRLADMTGNWVDEREYTLMGTIKKANLGRAILHPLQSLTALQRLILPRPRPAEEPVAEAQPKSVTLPVEECQYYFEWSTATASKYDDLFQEHARHTVYYEDLAQGKKFTLDEVQTFLGVKPQGLEVKTRRQNPEPLSELIANYDELRVAFQGTEFETFFD